MKFLHGLTLFAFFIAFILNLSEARAQVSIGLKGCYHLSTGETQSSPTSIDLDLYERLKVQDVQSFINKLVVGPKQKKYFSFLLADLTEQVCLKIEKDKNFSVIEKGSLKTDSTVYFFYKIKTKTGLPVNKIVYKQPQLTNSIMVDAVFKDEEEWSVFFKNKQGFIKSLKCAKK